MTHSTLTRRAGAATMAVGLGLGTTLGVAAAPAQAMRPVQERVDCIDYGKVAKAPKGAIPRDDLHIVKKDPLKIAAAKAARAARAAGVKNVSSAVPTVPDPSFAVTVPVRFHEILKTNGNGGGDLSNARIAAQIAALNKGFAGTGFTFVLQANTETVETEWWNLISANGAEPRRLRGGGKEINMKRRLADDNPATLEVYSASLGQFLLGFAYFPSDFTAETTSGLGPLPRFFDGVVIDYRTLPVVKGDTEGDQRVLEDQYDEGETLTHEVGHWLELFHTFQGGCPGTEFYRGGDQIADTPAEASPHFGCPEPPAPGEPVDPPRDTCPADPGLDPIHNFMDYSYDVCLTHFTPEQAARMQYAWQTYRD